jgi:hypothetical protein
MLFGNGSGLKKKRDGKARDKEQEKSGSVMGRTKSVVSSKRSTTGKFEGGTKFGDYFFIKKGIMRDK